jgi:hypothetical protein
MKKIAIVILIALLFSLATPVFACTFNNVGTLNNPNGPINIDQVTINLHFSLHIHHQFLTINPDDKFFNLTP